MKDRNNKLAWKIDQLHDGCILASIAHAIMVAHYPILSNEHSWDGFNYNVQNSAGMRGTVTFYDCYCVAAFRNEKSDRVGSKTAIDYFTDAPQSVIKLATNETLQYLLDDINGTVMPVITTAFWGKGNDLFTKDSFSNLLKYGGELLLKQTMDFDIAISKWVDNYEISSNQVELLKSIYARKTANPHDIIVLTKNEIEMIGTNDQEGLKESQISFQEININFG